MKDIEKEAVDFFCKTGRLYGLKDLQMTIFAVLYLEPESMPMEEIAERTGYSLASISNTMKFMQNLGIVQRIKKPGSRKVYFFVEKNLIKLNIRKLRAAQDTFVKSMKTQLPPIIRKYKKKARDEKSKQKLKIIENYYSQIKKFENILEDWRKDLEKLSQEM